MFKDLKKKADALKRSAEDQMKVLDLPDIKGAIENSKTKVTESAQKASIALGETNSKAKAAIQSGKDSASEAINKHWPMIEKVVVNGLVGLTQEKLNDEKFMTSTLGSIYELLPTPVRLVVSRDKFISSCLVNKEQVLLRIESYKTLGDESNLNSQESNNKS